MQNIFSLNEVQVILTGRDKELLINSVSCYLDYVTDANIPNKIPLQNELQELLLLFYEEKV